MSLHHIYSNASNSTQDITAYVRLYQWSATTDAKEGSAAHTTMVVDDPDGILDFVGHRRLYSYEDLAAPSNQVVYNGFIQNQKVSRGPYRNGAGRIWTLDLADPNVLLNRRVMNGADANRPAESDVNRLEALLGRGGYTQMTELNTVDDSLYFSGVDPVAMDAVDYRTQPAGTGYVDDCAQASGKNYFVWYREATGDYSLWYDFAESSNWSSAKRLSNVLADVDNSTTFAVDLEQEAVLDRDPGRVASGVMLPFDGVAVGSNTVSGTIYVQNQTTTDRFGAIDWLAPSLNVKTKAKAEARANRYLADAAEEDDLIYASVKLPAANVNDILAGMRVEAKFSHLPGYEDFTWMRCLSRTVTEISEDPTRAYRLDLELSPVVVLPSEVYWLSFLTQRASGGPSSAIVPRAFITSCGDGSPQAPWTWLEGGFVQGGPQYPFDVAYQVGTVPYVINDWGGAGGLDGGGRPTGYHFQLAGATGVPVYMDKISNQTPNTTFTAPTVIAPDDGWLLCLFSGRKDGDAAVTYTNTTAGATLQDQLYAQASPSTTFSPKSAMLYKPVSASDSVTFTITASTSTEWGAIVIFVPGDISIFEYQATGSGGSSLCWTWASLP